MILTIQQAHDYIANGVDLEYSDRIIFPCNQHMHGVEFQELYPIWLEERHWLYVDNNDPEHSL